VENKLPIQSEMQENKTIILSTGPLDDFLVDKAKENRIDIDIISFIHTEAIGSEELTRRIDDLNQEDLSIAFTSGNAAKAFAGSLNRIHPDWKIFSIGGTTKDILIEHFGKNSISGVASNASQLADVILSNKEIKEVIFFCGDQRRNELPDKLSQHGVNVTEIVVYRTTSTPQTILKAYDGILFYSPSAVHSFFLNNTIPIKTVLFAIGQTTVDTIQTYTNNPVVSVEFPGKEQMIEEVIIYFDTIKHYE
jgi:uroporphyrinogen-III synthase